MAGGVVDDRGAVPKPRVVDRAGVFECGVVMEVAVVVESAAVVDGAIVVDGAGIGDGAGIVNYAIVGDNDTGVYRKDSSDGAVASTANCKCGFGGNRKVPNAGIYM